MTSCNYCNHGSEIFVPHCFLSMHVLAFLSDSLITKHRFTIHDRMLFNPFELNRDENVCHDTDFDPDINFVSATNISYSTMNSTASWIPS